MNILGHDFLACSCLSGDENSDVVHAIAIRQFKTFVKLRCFTDHEGQSVRAARFDFFCRTQRVAEQTVKMLRMLRVIADQSELRCIGPCPCQQIVPGAALTDRYVGKDILELIHGKG